MKKITKISLLTLIIALLFCSLTPAYAQGNVTYSGDSGNFIFAPGSEYSPTDLFTDMKSVMPGDEISQKITVRNDASNKVKVEIYMRSLGAEQGSEDFLSQMTLKVKNATDTVMFEAAAHESAQLTEWTYLGLLYSGGEADMDITLTVPTSMDNDYSSKIGYLTWEFMIKEFPVEPEDPSPDTGDGLDGVFYVLIGICLVLLFFVIIFFAKRRKNNGDDEGDDKNDGNFENTERQESPSV